MIKVPRIKNTVIAARIFSLSKVFLTTFSFILFGSEALMCIIKLNPSQVVNQLIKVKEEYYNRDIRQIKEFESSDKSQG